MSIYLVTFGKLRYLGLMNIDDEPQAAPENTASENPEPALAPAHGIDQCADAAGAAAADIGAEDHITDDEPEPRLAELQKSANRYASEEQLSGWVLLRTARGFEMGLVGGKLSPEQEERYRSTKFDEGGSDSPRGPEPMLQEVQFIDRAAPEDIENYYQCRHDEEDVLIRSREILLHQDIDMKLVDVEYMLDYKKLFFYFTSEQRVDFRAYVRDLAREFRARIEMRQIGVRDEARLVKGIAPCGRQCCCSYWLHKLTPICIRMVKEQKLALNPTKISGICGRLMCCMAFEQDTYSELWSRLPGPGTKIKTEQGVYTLDSVDLATEHAIIRFPSGRLVPVSINEFEDFRDVVLSGAEWGEEPASSRRDKSRHGQLRGSQGRSGQPHGRQEQQPRRPQPQYQTERAPAREKVSLDEHLARKDSEAGDTRPFSRAEQRQGDRRRPPYEGRRGAPRHHDEEAPEMFDGGRPRRGGRFRDSGPQGRQRRR